MSNDKKQKKELKRPVLVKNASASTQVQNKDERVTTMPLSKTNFILMACCLALIVVGLWLMTGSANTGSTFNYDIFESRRTIVGPTIALLGFVLMCPAILYRGKKKPENNAEE